VPVRPKPADFSWINDSVIADAGCVTVVPAADPAKVLAAFGAVESTARPTASLKDVAVDDVGVEPLALVVEVGDAIVVVEPNGFQGSRPEVLRPASRASNAKKAGSFYWGVSAETNVAGARAGKLLFAVELIGSEDDELDGVPRTLRPLILEGGSEDGDMLACGFAADARFTQVELTPEILGAGTVYELEPQPSPLEEYRLDDDLYDLPEVQAVAGDLSPETLRRLAAWAARVAAHEGSVQDEPPVRTALDRVATTAPAEPVEVPPSLERLYAAAQTASNRFFQYEQELSWGGANLPDHGYHTAHVDGPMFGSTAISHLEGRFLSQRAIAIGASRFLGHPDALSAAMGALEWAASTVRNARVERGWTFEEDDRGRGHTGHEPDPRYDGFRSTLRALMEAVGGGADLDDALAAADASLPTPLTDEQRTSAIHADALAAAKGAFRTYFREPARRHDDWDDGGDGAIEVFVVELDD
jgi:hypothetical protein